MPKYPWMQFNTGDWLKDPELSMCQPATRGIWIDAIAAMHEKGRLGALSGTPDQLIRVLRCTEAALMSAIDDLQATGAADVTQRNGVVTLINRRMKREAKEREQSRIRQERFRDRSECNGENNGHVTEMSQSHAYIVINSDSLFEIFYKNYPRKENPQGARKAFDRAEIGEELLKTILAWLEKAKASQQWQDKNAIPHPTTFLNQRRWQGDPPPAKKAESKPDLIGESSQPASPRKHKCAACEDSGRRILVSRICDGCQGEVLYRVPWSEDRLSWASSFETESNGTIGMEILRCECSQGANYSNLRQLKQIA